MPPPSAASPSRGRTTRSTPTASAPCASRATTTTSTVAATSARSSSKATGTTSSTAARWAPSTTAAPATRCAATTSGCEPASADRLARRDLARVEAEQVEPAVEARVLHLDAAIHHHGEPLRLAVVGGLLVPDAELHPHRLRPDRERLIHHLGDVGGAAEHVDDVGHDRQIGQGLVHRLPEDLARVRIH